jgi:hypothetical protein
MGKHVIRQHYIPRMYLKRFADENGKICVFSKASHLMLDNQSIEKYACERFFYDTYDNQLAKNAFDELQRVTGGIKNHINIDDPQIVEKMLSRMESDISPILDGLSTSKVKLEDGGVKSKIAIFLHALSYRTSAWRNMQARFLNIMRTKNESAIKIGDIVPELCNVGEPKSNQLKELLSIESTLKVALMLTENYNWYLGKVYGTMGLLVADDPVAHLLYGFNDICFPISPIHAIILRVKEKAAPMISKDSPQDGEIFLSQDSVLRYNCLQAQLANKFIFGNKAIIKLMFGI